MPSKVEEFKVGQVPLKGTYRIPQSHGGNSSIFL